MELYLTLKEDNEDSKEFRLCNEEGTVVSSFSVEIDKDTALISYDI